MIGNHEIAAAKIFLLEVSSIVADLPENAIITEYRSIRYTTIHNSFRTVKVEFPNGSSIFVSFDKSDADRFYGQSGAM